MLPTTPPPPPALLTARECAARLRISLRTFYDHIKTGFVPKPLRIGRSVRWRLEDVQAVIDRMIAERDAVSPAEVRS